MDITGMSEQEYRWFVRECYKNQKLRPGEPVALEPFTLVLINLAVGLLLTAAAALLTPKPTDQEQKTPEEETIEGQNVVRRDRFAPKSGFDSFQNVVEMGSVVPIIYCNQTEIAGVTYGGLRVNTNLLWSQMLSVGGGQFFKGLFLVGEGGVFIDYNQIALGNNTLASYELLPDAPAGRVSLYYGNGGGRLRAVEDYKLGVTSDKDPGAITGGGSDVYSLNGVTDFCQAIQPSNQVEFGIYGHIGNNFGYKIGERFVATSQWQQGKGIIYHRQTSNQKYAEMRKDSLIHPTRAGFVEVVGRGLPEGEHFVQKGWELIYKILDSTEYGREYKEAGSTSGGEEESILNNHDVATTIASLQRGYDDNITIGGLYRAGSAIVICTERNDMFVSEVDFDGDGANTVTATFTVIEEGYINIWDESTLNYNGQITGGDGTSTVDEDFRTGKLCSEYSQLFQMLVASFSVERAFKTVEVGLQSNVGLKSRGITNFNSLVAEEYYRGIVSSSVEDGSYQAYIDAEFCGGQDFEDADEGESEDSYRKEILPGTYSAADTRYSFFRILTRDIDRDDFLPSDNLYAVRSATSVDVYNYIRFIFPTSKRREFRFMPVSSWEIRNEKAGGSLYALDPQGDQLQSFQECEYFIEFNGFKIEDKTQAFKVKAFLPPPERTEEVCETVPTYIQATRVKEGGQYTLTQCVEFDDSPGVCWDYQEDILVRSTTDPSRELQLEVTLRREPGEPFGEVRGVRILGDDGSQIQPENTAGWEDGEEFVFATNQPNGNGFVGYVQLTDDEVCEDVTVGGPQLGFAEVDDVTESSYVDGYARIAEAFVYDSVTTTATQAEHRISYVNIISENEDTPEYDAMSLIGLNIRSSKELRNLDQLSVYCTGGIRNGRGEHINLFPEVFNDLLRNPRYGTGEFFDGDQIDGDSFAQAATWTKDRKYFFDGAISEKINLRTWGAERARDFLLDLSISGGRFKLTPTVNFYGAEQVTALYSSGNIIEDSLSVNYFDTQDRLDPIVTVRWREERRDSSLDSKGLFPQIREFSVRRAGVSENAPVIQVDLSNFCTNREHALDRAKLECQSKRYITHAVSFKTVPSEIGIQAGSIIKLGIETVYYEQPQNGAISNTGEVTSWPPLADGTYSALIWDGSQLTNGSITVVDGMSAANKNCVFSLERAEGRAETYKVSSVSFDEDGNVDVEALYWPTNAEGRSLLVVDWENDAWEIDG